MARQRRTAPSGNNWTLTYGDMITLLMVFFVILWSMARMDLEKYEQVAQAMRSTFSNQAGVADGTGGSGSQAFSVLDADDLGSFTSEYSRPVAMEMPVTSYDQRDVSAELGDAIASAGLAGEVQVRTQIEGVIVSLSEALVFPPGSAELQPRGREALDSIAPILVAMRDNDIRVQGHTDDRPTGNPAYPTNWELSAARAISIVRYLETQGVHPSRLSATGLSSHHPLYTGDDAESRIMNRRAEIVIVYPLEESQFQVQLFPELGELRYPVVPISQ